VAGHRGPSSVAQSATGALPATAWPSGGEPPARLPPRPRCPLPNGGLTGPQAPRCDPRSSVPAAPLPAGAPVPAAPLLAGSSVPAAAPPAGSSVSAVAPFAGARVQIPVTHAGLSTHAAAPSAAPQEAGGAARLNGAAAQGSAPAPIPRPARAEPDPRPVSLQPSPDPGFWAGFKGVRQQSRGWSSRSKHNGEFRFLGSYDSPVATTSSPPLRSTPLGEAAAAYDLFVVGTVLASRWRLNFPRLRALYIELTHPNQRSISTHLLTQQLPILGGGALQRAGVRAAGPQVQRRARRAKGGSGASAPQAHALHIHRGQLALHLAGARGEPAAAQLLLRRRGRRPSGGRLLPGCAPARGQAWPLLLLLLGLRRGDLLLESEDPTCCLRLHYEVLPPKDACEPRLEATWNTPTIASDECIRM
ncbi:hypothetical protein APUTEX25_003972, partial [Auxenochlorella protothecoides]